MPNVGFNAVVGRPVSEYGFEPVRFDEMRRGAWDIHERARHGPQRVYASLNFPSFLPGFAYQRPQQVTTDRDLAMALGTGLNDWHFDVWAYRTGTGSSRASCRGCWTPKSAPR